jgi:hypothetical protein
LSEPHKISRRQALATTAAFGGLEALRAWRLPRSANDKANIGFQRPAKTIARPSSHWTEWIEAAKQGTQPSCNWEYGGHITELCLLGNIAIALHGTVLHFDAAKRRFANSDSGNAMFSRDRCWGWELPAQS